MKGSSMSNLQPDQTNLINAQIAKLHDMAQSTEQALDALGTAEHTLRQMSLVALEGVNFMLTMFAKDASPGSIVPLKEYDEASYVYYDNIEDDPMWGVDFDARSETDPYWGVEDGRNIVHGYHLDQLGWMIRTAERTPESLASLYKHRDWLGRCRAAGVDPYSREGASLEEGYAEYASAEAQERRKKRRGGPRIQPEFALRQALRDAREEGLDCAAIIADELARPVVSGIYDSPHVGAPDDEEATDT
jgi:hypothetical protein